MSEYTDKTQMPFGKHKGLMLINVPADYLIHLHGEISHTAPNKRTFTAKLLMNYIEENMDVLKLEFKNKNHE